MSTRMLIDARHPEETRVAVVKGNRIEEFDFEAAAKKQLKGNIYLAKVTRVEPSLQAAFVEYGGNRHGFLPFSEIHPDYYQIPKEDRDALLREEQEAARHDQHDDHHDDHHDDEQAAIGGTDAGDADTGDGSVGSDSEEVEEHGGHDADASEALRRKRMALRRRYKIQEVIRRRQVMLVQVVKEERGNKGAALTTYLSLAGRYSVLMPNTHHGGGISRKISNQADRKRLKAIMQDLQLPAGMGAIVRTAGLARTKTEIKRDFDYLCRLWDEIREATLNSSAPALIHQDSDLIKRAIRDIYTRDIDQVLVEGEDGYRAAKTFMKLLMPSHAKKVQQYADPIPLFQRFGVEGQLAAMMNPVVQLRSGGYIVINPTEALVSIDINSGRSTREHNIEETATKTNIEAAEEIARQLRLRDMAGLIVIDFIDMENSGNIRKVEKAMKEALKNDRARIQVGRISIFGLMEMSRQRLRTGVLEASTHTCPMCDGIGLVRSVPSAALAALRTLEEEAIKGKASLLTLRAATDVAIYILNRKRGELAELEGRYGVSIEVAPDGELMPSHFAIEGTGGAPAKPLPAVAAIPLPVAVEEDEDLVELPEPEPEAEAEEADEREIHAEEEREDRGRGRRRRRRRRSRRGEGDASSDADEAEVSADAGAEATQLEAVQSAADQDAEIALSAEADDAGGSEEERRRRRRRRGRRGGRRREGDLIESGSEASDAALTARGDLAAVVAQPDMAADADAVQPAPVADVADAPELPQLEPVSDASMAADAPATDEAPVTTEEAPPTTSTPLAADAVAAEAAPKAKPVRRRTRKAAAAVAADAPLIEQPAAPVDAEPAPKRKRATRTRKAAAVPEAASDAPAAENAPAAEAVGDAGAVSDAPATEAASDAGAVSDAPATEAVSDAGAMSDAPATEAVGDAGATMSDAPPAAAAAAAALVDTAAVPAAEAVPASSTAANDAEEQTGTDDAEPRPARKGWWQRTFGA